MRCAPTARRVGAKAPATPGGAEAAARAALNGDASVVAESADGCVEAIRAVGVARRSAIGARTVAPNQINAVAVTAPEGLQDQLKGAHNP